jgi:hypothetical protein
VLGSHLEHADDTCLAVDLDAGGVREQLRRQEGLVAQTADAAFGVAGRRRRRLA